MAPWQLREVKSRWCVKLDDPGTHWFETRVMRVPLIWNRMCWSIIVWTSTAARLAKMNQREISWSDPRQVDEPQRSNEPIGHVMSLCCPSWTAPTYQPRWFSSAGRSTSGCVWSQELMIDTMRLMEPLLQDRIHLEIWTMNPSWNWTSLMNSSDWEMSWIKRCTENGREAVNHHEVIHQLFWLLEDDCKILGAHPASTWNDEHFLRFPRSRRWCWKTLSLMKGVLPSWAWEV